MFQFSSTNTLPVKSNQIFIGN